MVALRTTGEEIGYHFVPAETLRTKVCIVPRKLDLGDFSTRHEAKKIQIQQTSMQFLAWNQIISTNLRDFIFHTSNRYILFPCFSMHGTV